MNGDLNPGYSAQELIKTDFLHQAVQKLGYDAFNIGEAELMLGLDSLLAKAKQNPIYISANVLDPQTRKPIFPGTMFKTFSVNINGKPVDIRVGIIGVISKDLEPDIRRYFGKDSAQYIIADHMVTLKSIVPEVRKRADLVIVMPHIGFYEAEGIADAIPGIDIIIAGHDGFQVVASPQIKNKTIVVNNGDRGRFCGMLNLQFKENKKIDMYRGKEVHLSGDFPNDPEMSMLVDNYKKAISESANKMVPSMAKTTESQYTTAESCGKCHSRAFKLWQESRHSHALKSLKPGNNDKRNECITCHTLGFGKPGGYVSEKQTPKFAHVQCESCHGPGKSHIQASRGMKSKMIIKPAKETCLQCHNKDNDPTFDFAAKLPRIKHW